MKDGAGFAGDKGFVSLGGIYVEVSRRTPQLGGPDKILVLIHEGNERGKILGGYSYVAKDNLKPIRRVEK